MIKFVMSAILWACFAGGTATADVSFGVILKSWHYDDNPALRENNPGVFVTRKGWSAGAYRNSVGDNSIFVSRSIAVARNITIDIGVANGYERAGFDVDGYIPLLAATYNYKGLLISANPRGFAMGYQF